MRSELRRILMVAGFLATAAVIPVAAQVCAATDYDCKIAAQSKTIVANPANSEAYYNRAMAYKGKGDFARAKTDLDKYISLPNSNNEYLADGYTERGWARYKTSDNTGALADYDKAIALNAKNASAHFRKGMIYSDQDKWQLAVNSFDQALRIDPQEFEVFYNRGRAYRMMGSYEKALAEYTQYIAVNTAKLEYAADGYRGRGMTYFALGKYDLAVSDHTKAIQFDPKIASSYEERAKAYRKLNKIAEAVADETKAKQLK